MNARRIGKLLSTGLLVFALVGLALPTTAATSPPKVSIPALCQVASPSPDYVTVLNAVAPVPSRGWSAGPEMPWMWAVGYTAARVPVNTARATLTMFYDGRTWQMVPSPNVGTENVLTAVAARNASDVWAVGYSRTNNQTQPLILHFNGQTWSVWQTPTSTHMAPQPWNTYLNDVQIVTSKTNQEVVAVGYTEAMGRAQPLVLYYNGVAWAPMTLPPEMMLGRLYAVTGSSLNDLWAVGTLEFGETPEAYLFHYTQGAWNLVGKGTGILTDLAVATDGRVFTVGHVTTFFNKMETLAMVYTPALGNMTLIKTFNKAVDQNVLTGLASSGSRIYAVGYADNPAKGLRETLVQAYDGASFVPVTTPNPAAINQVNAAAFNPVGVFWAVGASGVSLQRSTLILSDRCGDVAVNTW